MSKTPKLRFKEFSGDWEKKKLGKITKLTDGVHFTPTYVESGVPFWSVETVVSNAKPKYITEEAHKEAIKRCYPQVDDILLTRIGTLAKPKLIDWNEEFSIYVSLALIKASTNYNSKFARYYFETEYYQKDFLSKSLLTATPKKINMEDLKQTNIKLPSKEEQEKIASFFSLIDDKISLQSEKVEALRDYKKGMMQKIFSRELRFKDKNGEDYPEWESDIFKNIIKFEKKSKYPASTKKINGLYRFILSNSSSEKWYCDEYILNKETIIINDGGVANFTYMDGKFAYSDHCIAVSTEKNTRYLYYYLEYNKKRIDYVGFVGSGLRNIDRNYLNNFKIKLPSLPEQEKIANFLFLIDSKIELEQEKLKQLQEYKKGLLQQMFV